MTSRLAASVVTACLWGAATAHGQAPPELTRQQRQLLQNLIAAVDSTAADPAAASPADDWLTHVLRASDGSHYIAFSVTPAAGTVAADRLVIYVRLATAIVPGETAVAERSVVREWLQGARIDPRLLPRRGIAIGEMPEMGAGANINRSGVSAVGSADLKIMDLERERSRQRREDDEKRRRSELEGATITSSDRFPFEDFEIGPPAAFTDGTRAIQRALTVGPGAYDLFVAWVDASLPPTKAPIHVARESLRLAPAGASEFGLSTVIVADQIRMRAAPYSPLEQRAHPYSLGPTEIVPARDTAFTPAERLSVAFQIFNPMPSPAGKPDVIVNLRIARMADTREEQVASLTPLIYNAATLPEDFDLRLRHPIIAALAVPLSTLRRGQYKLVITAEDRLAGAVVANATPFSVIGTPAGLLAEAPPLAQRLDPAVMLGPGTVAALLDRLAPPSPSPALGRALDAARAGRFVDLLVEESPAPAEGGLRAALTGLALLSVGDLGAATHFQRALDSGVARPPVQYLLGAVLALQNRESDAISAWESAAAGGLPRALTAALLANALLRRGDAAGAAAAIAERDLMPEAPAGRRIFAATRIAVQREREAVRVLEALLTGSPGDLEGRWLLVHALYAEVVRGAGNRDHFNAEAQRYIDAGGPHAALARDWLDLTRPSP